MKYKFLYHGDDGLLYWQRYIPGDSRVEQISCPADWFYAQMIGALR